MAMNNAPPPSAEHSATQDGAMIVDLSAVVGPVTDVLDFYDDLADQRSPNSTPPCVAYGRCRRYRAAWDETSPYSPGVVAAPREMKIHAALQRLRNVAKFAGVQPT